MIGQFPWDPFPPDTPAPRGPDPLQAIAYQAAVKSADAYRGVREALQLDRDLLRIGNRFVPAGRYRDVAFVALGNAAVSMTLGALRSLGDFLAAGILAGPALPPPEVPFRGIEIPIGWPGRPAAEEVVRSVTELAEGLAADELLLLLLSPGALAALALPPRGMTGEEFGHLLEVALERGGTGREVERIARVLGRGGVGGALGRIATKADVATFLVDRGHGATLLGGGPMHAVRSEEHAEARAVLDRLSLTGILAGASRDALGDLPEKSPPPPRFRPVYVAQPTDALQSAANALYDRKWRSRLAMLQVEGTPEVAAETFAQRVDDLLAHEPDLASDKSRGIGAFAMTTLGLPEGVDEGPALGRFLERTQQCIRRRELNIGLFRTAGGLGTSLFPGGAVVGQPTNPEFAAHAGRARAVPMERAVTDVGCLVVALWPGAADG